MRQRVSWGRWLVVWILAVLLPLTAAVAQEARPLVKGQTLYLPIYSHMLYGNLGKSGKASYVLLSALVSIRNTDARRPIRVLAAKYFDTNGKLLGERVPTPMLVSGNFTNQRTH